MVTGILFTLVCFEVSLCDIEFELGKCVVRVDGVILSLNCGL